MQAINQLKKDLKAISKLYEAKKIGAEIVIEYNEQILCQLHKESDMGWCLSFAPMLVFPGIYGIQLLKDIIPPIEKFERNEV